MKPGALLKEELKAKRGLEYKFVALRTGIPYSTLRHYLNDIIPIPEVKIRTICLTFGIAIEKFGFDKPEIQQQLRFAKAKTKRMAKASNE